jgi:hypothetical protein
MSGTRRFYGPATPTRGYPGRGSAGRPYPGRATARAERARVFLSYRQNDHLLDLTLKMKRWLAHAGVDAYRAVDDPRAGESLTAKFAEGIANAHGLVLFWSPVACKSKRIAEEKDLALKLGKRVCLIKFPGVPEPDGWDPDIEWVPLRGVRFLKTRGIFGWTWLDSGEFESMMGDIKAFATRARNHAGRAENAG